MGRGPGNTKTEELINFFTNKGEKIYKSNNKKTMYQYFQILRGNINGEQIDFISYQANIKFILLIFKIC